MVKRFEIQSVSYLVIANKPMPEGNLQIFLIGSPFLKGFKKRKNLYVLTRNGDGLTSGYYIIRSNGKYYCGKFEGNNFVETYKDETIKFYAEKSQICGEIIGWAYANEVSENKIIFHPFRASVT